MNTPKTQISLRLQHAMDQAGMSMRDAAEKFDLTYEYIRRVCKGDTNVSKNVLKVFCHEFGWDYKEMEQLLVDDRFRTRNGVFGAIAQQFNPEVEPFEKGWFLLDQTQKEFLLANLNLFLAQNRRSTRGGKNKAVEGVA